MSVIATLSIPAADFTLGGALSPNPGIRVRLERVIPVGETFIPYLWASNDALGEIESALRAEADISSFTIVDRLDDEALVRVEWDESVDGFLAVLARTNASILDGEGEADTWRFQLRFDDQDELTAFYRECADRGVAVTLESVHTPGTSDEFGPDVDLTDTQRETLLLALERGYFDVPRRVNFVELADELGVSDTAVSQRLRRGTETLLAAVLDENDPSE